MTIMVTVVRIMESAARNGVSEFLLNGEIKEAN